MLGDNNEFRFQCSHEKKQLDNFSQELSDNRLSTCIIGKEVLGNLNFLNLIILNSQICLWL